MLQSEHVIEMYIQIDFHQEKNFKLSKHRPFVIINGLFQD